MYDYIIQCVLSFLCEPASETWSERNLVAISSKLSAHKRAPSSVCVFIFVFICWSPCVENETNKTQVNHFTYFKGKRNTVIAFLPFIS